MNNLLFYVIIYLVGDIMQRYYYHGFDNYDYEGGIEHIIEIIKSGGLKNRNDVKDLGDNNYNHVCLYRKNEEYDYASDEHLLRSARGGWIDGCMVFIISPEIEAYKVRYSESGIGFDEEGPYSNLVDEYRSVGDIPNSKIVGIALPLNGIGKYLDDNIGEERKTRLRTLFSQLMALMQEYKFQLKNSEEENFTDKLDEELNIQMTK